MSNQSRIEKLPPERRRRRVVVSETLYGCCCSCCCCCLHTVGSLLGAAITSRVMDPADAAGPALTEQDFLVIQEQQRTQRVSETRSVALYWGLVALACVVALLWFYLEEMSQHVNQSGRLSEDLLIFAVVVAVFFPLGQLGVSLVALILVALAPSSWLPDKSVAALRIARITGATFVGGLAGILAMVVLGLAAGLH